MASDTHCFLASRGGIVLVFGTGLAVPMPGFPIASPSRLPPDAASLLPDNEPHRYEDPRLYGLPIACRRSEAPEAGGGDCGPI